MVPRKNLKEDLVRCLEKHDIEVDAMYLFGSHARGEQKQGSDIDVLVVSRSFAGKSFWTRCSLLGEMLGDLPLPIQVYPVTFDEFNHPEPGGFLESILGECKTLYKRNGPRVSIVPRAPLGTK